MATALNSVRPVLQEGFALDARFECERVKLDDGAFAAWMRADECDSTYSGDDLPAATHSRGAPLRRDGRPPTALPATPADGQTGPSPGLCEAASAESATAAAPVTTLWLHYRLAGLHLRRLLDLGLDQQHGTWALA